MMDMAMTNELHLTRRLRRLTLAIGLTLAGASAHAQSAPPPADPGITGATTQQDGDRPAAASTHRRHSRGEIRPYLEVAQVLSADLDHGGETLTYTSVAAGVDGHIETRRITAQMSVRYEHHFDWQNQSGDQDVVSGVAMVHAEVAPGVLSLDAGGIATRTGGTGRTFGVTNQDQSVDVYSVYAGPTLATNAGPLAINGAYRFGYTKVDDHTPGGRLNDDFDSATAHSLTGSVGMAPNRGLPFGWTVGAGYARENSGGRFRNRFEGAYVRGDVVVPVGPTLALTAGVGYENIQSSQRDVVRDAGGVPIPDAQGRLTPDPSAPRLLTYDMDGVMYDGGVIWRPSPRTELQARAGHRYGGTTYVGSLSHRIGEHAAVNAVVYDTVETFGRQLTTQISGLPANSNFNRDPLTGGLGGCFFGQSGGGVCLDRSLQSITGSTFRARGASIAFSGERNRWSYGIGAGYNHRRYFLPSGAAFVATQASSDEDVSVYGSIGRQLTRTSEIDFNAYASWYDSDLPGSHSVTSQGATLSYSRSFLLERLQLLAAMGLYHSDDGTESATNASGQLGLRYTF
jgi:hypothetical protein